MDGDSGKIGDLIITEAIHLEGQRRAIARAKARNKGVKKVG
jgi:hypothetical protein